MIPLRVLCGSDPGWLHLIRDAKMMDGIFDANLHFLLTEVKHGKPHPEPYHVTMRRFSQPPASAENVLVFEDSINGAMSAALAGCTVIYTLQLLIFLLENSYFTPRSLSGDNGASTRSIAQGLG